MFSLTGVLLAVAGVQGCAPGDLAAEFETRFHEDQAARRAIAEYGKTDETLQRVLDLERENQAWLEAVLEECGWPARSAVGARAAHAAWRLVLHADRDQAFQKTAAAAMRKAVKEGEASANGYATLVDRHRRREDEPQRYGTQYEVGERITFWPIETPEALDQRREAIGLPPFYCHVRTLEKREGSQAQWPEGVVRQSMNCNDDE